ncbi:RMD1 family protein [Pelosinus sp. sgz500959]|uniref:RMD1 family protein n=1 Tax=Pelosinus sp. sgz500959 TaxID=3242472 RepID=UPI0036712090
MLQTEFKAIVLSNEIDLNKIAQHFGIDRKFKWEESLVLHSVNLQGIVQQTDIKKVYIFYFGSVVFLNFQHHEIMDVINYIQNIGVGIIDTNGFKYVDEYKIESNPTGIFAINNEYMVTGEQAEYQFDIVSTVLAKSVALDKIEMDISYLLDEIEDVVNDLHQGKLAVSDEKLAKMSASILGFKLSAVSYIMLLDKPAITWNNEDASELFDELVALFELSERYGNNRHKIDTLMDITEVFSGLAHAKRGTRLEWAVIILILIEIVLSVFDLFFKHKVL